jgi:transcriptional regulator with XRE-family HTH domain
MRKAIVVATTKKTAAEKVAERLGKRIRRLRKLRNFSQDDVAVYIKSSRRRPVLDDDVDRPDTIGRKAISDYETGRRLPTMRTLVGIAEALKVDVAVLLLDPDESSHHRIALAALAAPDKLLPALAKLLDVKL